MLIVSLAIYILTAILLCWRYFKQITLTRVIILFFITSVAINILVAEILSLVKSLDHPWLFLLIQVLICVLLTLVLIDPANRIFREKLQRFQFTFEGLKTADILLLTLIALVLAGSFYIGTLAPISNSDSLHTHLPRIYYWIQHGSLVNWDSPADTQLFYPINLPLQGLWIFLLGQNEKLFFLVQWASLLVVAALLFELSMLLGANRTKALVASLTGLSLPAVLLQVYSYQGDLFIAAVLLTIVYFLVLFEPQRNSSALNLSVVPLAIGLGAKQTALLFLPVYALVFLILLLKKHITRKMALVALALFLVSFSAFAAYKYVQNLGQKDVTKASKFPTLVILEKMQKDDFQQWLLATNLRYKYQVLSLDGLTGRGYLFAQRVKNNLFQTWSRRMNLDLESLAYLPEGENDYFTYSDVPHLNEDSAWYGPLSLFLIPIAVVLTLLGKNSSRKSYTLFSLLLLVIFYASLLFTIQGWTNTSGRYFIFPTLVLVPLLSFLIPNKRFTGSLTASAIVILAFFLAFSTLLMNENRPILTQRSLYVYQSQVLENLDTTIKVNDLYKKAANRVIENLVLTSPSRESIFQNSYYENLFFQNTADLPDIQFVNVNLPARTPLYLRIQKTTLEYALFGVNRTRDLFPVANLDHVPAGATVLIAKSLLPTNLTDLQLVAENPAYSLFKRK
jgi:hypothetical protein